MDTVVSGEGIANGLKQLRQRKKEGDKEFGSRAGMAQMAEDVAPRLNAEVVAAQIPRGRRGDPNRRWEAG